MGIHLSAAFSEDPGLKSGAGSLALAHRFEAVTVPLASTIEERATLAQGAVVGEAIEESLADALLDRLVARGGRHSRRLRFCGEAARQGQLAAR